MKSICAIYNVFDGEELLEGSIRQLKDVAHIVAVTQVRSNWGEPYGGGAAQALVLKEEGLIDKIITYAPDLSKRADWNETQKRMIGIRYARENGYGWFMHMDCDEYYDTEDVNKLLGCIEMEYDAFVAHVYTYFKEPTLTMGREGYYVPLVAKTSLSCGPKYFNYFPYYADPTRCLNTKNVLETNIDMHHYSWIRNDINRKIRNSTARHNIEKSNMIKQYHCAKEGDYIEFTKKKLILCEDRFNIRNVLHNPTSSKVTTTKS